MGGGVHGIRWRWRGVRAFCCLAPVLVCLFGESAYAGAWTRAKGEGVILSSFSHHQFDLGYAGFEYSKLESAVYAEYGLTDRFTLYGRLSRETRIHVAPALRRAGVTGDHTVRTVSSALGESALGARTRLISSGRWTVSAQAGAVRFATEPNPLLKPDTRWGLDSRLLIGRSLGQAQFIEAQLARRQGVEGEDGETRLDLSWGVRPAERWLILAQSYSAWGEGGWGAYLTPYESHRIHLSVIAPVTEGLSLQLGAINSVSSDRIAPERAYMISLWREF